MAKMVAKDRKGPRKGPTVRVQLGRGHVDLGKEGALDPHKGKAELEPLEDGGVHEEEGFFGVCTIVSTHGKTFPTRQNL